MANNVQQYRVSGEAPISVGTGSGGALEVLGVSMDGVSIQIVQKEKPIYSDVGGSESPVDFQRMGEEAYISMKLASWVEDIRRKLEARPFKYPDNTVSSRQQALQFLAVSCSPRTVARSVSPSVPNKRIRGISPPASLWASRGSRSARIRPSGNIDSTPGYSYRAA